MVSNEKLLEMVQNGDFIKVRQALIENIRLETVKKTCKISDNKIVQRCLKSASNLVLASGHTPFSGWNLFCNGYYILADDNFDFGIPEIKKENQFDFSKILNCNAFEDFTNCVMIDKKDLEFFKKIHKKDKLPYRIIVEDKKFYFNPSYLLDCLNFCNTNTICLNNSSICIGQSENNNRFFYLLGVSPKSVDKSKYSEN